VVLIEPRSCWREEEKILGVFPNPDPGSGHRCSISLGSEVVPIDEGGRGPPLRARDDQISAVDRLQGERKHRDVDSQRARRAKKSVVDIAVPWETATARVATQVVAALVGPQQIRYKVPSKHAGQVTRRDDLRRETSIF
jgi:hypothetical protein